MRDNDGSNDATIIDPCQKRKNKEERREYFWKEDVDDLKAAAEIPRKAKRPVVKDILLRERRLPVYFNQSVRGIRLIIAV